MITKDFKIVSLYILDEFCVCLCNERRALAKAI